MNELLIAIGVVLLIGFLSAISEIRTSRKRLESRLQQVELLLAEIRDALKAKS